MSAQDVEAAAWAWVRNEQLGMAVPVNQEELLTVAPEPLVQYGPKGGGKQTVPSGNGLRHFMCSCTDVFPCCYDLGSQKSLSFFPLLQHISLGSSNTELPNSFSLKSFSLPAPLVLVEDTLFLLLCFCE